MLPRWDLFARSHRVKSYSRALVVHLDSAQYGDRTSSALCIEKKTKPPPSPSRHLLLPRIATNKCQKILM
jgi:hypothetical protein